MRGLKTPGHFDKVYKEECQFCFDTPESPGGLFINLKTFQVQAAGMQLGSQLALLPALATMVLGVAMVAACCMQRCAASTPACRPLVRATSSWTMPGRQTPCTCTRHGARYGREGRDWRCACIEKRRQVAEHIKFSCVLAARVCTHPPARTPPPRTATPVCRGAGAAGRRPGGQAGPRGCWRLFPRRAP